MIKSVMHRLALISFPIMSAFGCSSHSLSADKSYELSSGRALTNHDITLGLIIDLSRERLLKEYDQKLGFIVFLAFIIAVSLKVYSDVLKRKNSFYASEVGELCLNWGSIAASLSLFLLSISLFGLAWSQAFVLSLGGVGSLLLTSLIITGRSTIIFFKNALSINKKPESMNVVEPIQETENVESSTNSFEQVLDSAVVQILESEQPDDSCVQELTQDTHVPESLAVEAANVEETAIESKSVESTESVPTIQPEVTLAKPKSLKQRLKNR